MLDKAENPGDIKKEISKSDYNRKLKYVLGTFVAKKNLLVFLQLRLLEFEP